MQRGQKVKISIFGVDLGWTSSQVIRITHNAQVAYLRFRLAQQDYENKLLTERII